MLVGLQAEVDDWSHELRWVIRQLRAAVRRR
jgi:hypothetical protein